MPASNFVAGGNINPSRFVKMAGTTNAFTVIEATAGDEVIGISQEFPRDAPIPGASTLAAAAGETIKVYGVGDECLLEIGAACNSGALLKSEADGEGTPVTTDKDKYGAVALMDATADGDKIRVRVHIGHAAV